MRLTRALSVTALASALALAGCGRDAEPPATPLGYVPAETPFVFANLEPTPKAVLETWNEKFAAVWPMYEDMRKRALADLEAEGSEAIETRVAQALLAELEGKLSLDGMRSLGLDPAARWAIYGVGLVPVMRFELADPAAFEGFVGRVEQRVGENMPRAAVDGQSYWRLGPAEGRLVGLMAIHEGDLVLSLMPREASETLRRRLLGLELPESRLDDAFAGFNDERGYLPFGSGYVDFVRLSTALLDEKSGIEGEFLAALEVENKPTSPVCREELLALAGKLPRLSFGYTELEPERMDMHLVLETDAQTGASLAQLAAPVPGMGRGEGAVFDVGFSLDLAKLSAFIGEQAAKVAADPFECESLVQINTDMAQMQSQVNNPMVLASAPLLRGMYAAMTRFEPVEGGTPVLAGKLVLASDNPQALVSMAQSFLPPLGQLQLAPGGEPVPLPAELGGPQVPPTHLVMGEKAIGVALGDGEQAGLVEFISAEPATPAPLLVVGYSGAFFAAIADSMQGAVAAMPEEQRAEMEQSAALIREVYGKSVERIELRLVATERGLELRQAMALR